ncbi:hypothetical protein GOODEAATRI_021662 [Goodea atripinnis]|uniref:Uncharacterized protein n=1 Tax=Goodea atripinnis TaxID=208336 RepID=A0ABV0PQZ3_9TELE
MENQTDRMLIGRPGDAPKTHWKVEAVKAWKMSCCLWGSMTATWTKALGFLSLPEAARSLQASQRKSGRKGEPRGRRERRSRKKIGDERREKKIVTDEKIILYDAYINAYEWCQK